MYKIFILVIFILFGITEVLEAQRYPLPVLPQRELSISSTRGTRNIKSGRDTLWILSGRQFKSALAKAKKLELSEEQMRRYTMQLEIFREKSKEKDSVISVLEKDRNYYMDNFKMCSQDVKKEARRNKRKSLFNKLALAGIPVAFVIGFFVGK